MIPLASRRILVTGGTSGIGLAIVRLLTAQQAHVGVLARDERKLARTGDETGAATATADLRDPDAAVRAVADIAATLGGIDVLINNAGSFPLGTVSDGVIADWQEMVALNITALLAVTQACVPYLAAGRHPHIVNISSMSGRRVTDPTTGVYAGTKHAVHAISEGLRRELHRQKVRLTVISPGVVRTNLGEGIRNPGLRDMTATQQENEGLHPDHVAAQVAHALTAPPDVHIHEIALTSARQHP